jgi:Ca2+-binding RTX toxin-like protein
MHTETYSGWTEQKSGTADVTLAGPGDQPGDSGSAQFSVGANGNSAAQLRIDDYNGMLLSDLTDLSYNTFVTQDGAGGQAPYIILNIDLDGNGTTDDQLFFEPVYQDGSYGTLPGSTIATQQSLATGVWQTWDADDGGWWSLNAGTFGPPLTSLDAYIAAHPGARLAAPASGAGSVRLVTGFGAGAWDNFVGSVDEVSIGFNGNVDSFDFGPNAAPTANSDLGVAGENETKLFDVVANDTDPDGDALTLGSIESVTVTSANGAVNNTDASGAFSIDSNQVKFNPGSQFDALKQGETAIVTVTYKITDSSGHESSSTLTLTVNGAADATINGTNKADVIHGDQGPGGAGREDHIFGGNGNDQLFGEAGADDLWGGNGDDTLWGGVGDDDLRGENGNDDLNGGAGEDWLAGGNGNDRLTGGADADIFSFGKGGGNDTVTDFDVTQDQLELLDGVTIKSVKVLDADGVGPLDTVLQLSNGGGSVTLLGTGAQPATVAHWDGFVI